jgi:hypothetical protein
VAEFTREAVKIFIEREKWEEERSRKRFLLFE